MTKHCTHDWTENKYEGPLTRYCNFCNETEIGAELAATKSQLATAIRELDRIKAVLDEMRKERDR